MPSTTTVFDVNDHHIHIPCRLFLGSIGYPLDAILDTGASRTEMSTSFLVGAQILKNKQLLKAPVFKEGQQTQKIGKIFLPNIEICGQVLKTFEVFVSHFEGSWGIDALIGLDFFRKFQITIDYSKGEIRTQSFSADF